MKQVISGSLEEKQNGARILVSPECIACGVCLAMTDYVEETKEGKAVPKGSGIINCEEIIHFNEVIEQCPVHAISLDRLEQQSSDNIKKMMEEKLNGFSLHRPAKGELSFDSSLIKIPFVASSKEYQYNYSSYNRAKEAAKEEINRLMYSQRKTIIENVLVQYKTQKVRPYYTYEQVEGNFFYQAEQQLKKLLEEVVSTIKLSNPNAVIPFEIEKIQTRPDLKSIFIDNFSKNWFEDRNASKVLHDMSDSFYSLDSYAADCDIEDTEMYVGTGMFGKEKYETKYCFHNLSEAFKEMEKDIKYACESVIKEDVVDEAQQLVTLIIENYEAELKKELNQKAELLKSLI